MTLEELIKKLDAAAKLAERIDALEDERDEYDSELGRDVQRISENLLLLDERCTVDRTSADAGRNELWEKAKLLERRMDELESNRTHVWRNIEDLEGETGHHGERLTLLEKRLDDAGLESGAAIAASGPLPSTPAGRHEQLHVVAEASASAERARIVKLLRAAAEWREVEAAQPSTDRRLYAEAAVLCRTLAARLERGEDVL